MTAKAIALHVAGALVVALYFSQTTTMAPNHTDGGLILSYIDDMANGWLPYYDLVDAYGLLNWPFAVLGYVLAGHKVWGIRIWILVCKLIVVAISYKLVTRLANRRYAILTVVWLTVLLGQAWQSLQTNYASLTAAPFVLGAWYFITARPLPSFRNNVYGAALLTTAAIWTKINTGMFLLAGGLFAYFYFFPEPRSDSEPRQHRPKWLVWAQVLGCAAYLALFFLFVRQHFNQWYLVYLILPLGLGLGLTVASIVVDPWRRQVPARAHLEPWALFLGLSALGSVAILLFYYGVRGAPKYIAEQYAILSNIDYAVPFPPLGVPGLYVHFNEYFWPQLPCLLTVLFGVWLVFGHRLGPRAFGSGWHERKAEIGALWMLITLHSFVLYARSDETHIFQAMVLDVPVLFVLLHQLERLARARTERAGRAVFVTASAAALVYIATLVVIPTGEAFEWGDGDWHQPKLAGLHYRPKGNRYVRDYSPFLTDHDWDIAVDETAQYIDSLTEPGEEILVLSPNRFIQYASDTRSVGGRYRFYLYLVSVGLLDRAAFDRIVPDEAMHDILTHPPRVIVGTMGRVPLLEAFPEFRWLMAKWYVETRHYRHIIVYELRIRGKPKSRPWRILEPRGRG